MIVRRLADLHSSSSVAHDSALLALCCMGADILDPFPEVGGGYCFLYVAIDKFHQVAQGNRCHHHQ
jgi:hypothetical protein